MMYTTEIVESVKEKSKTSTNDLIVYHFHGKENPDVLYIHDENFQFVDNPLDHIEWIYGNNVMVSPAYYLYSSCKCNVTDIDKFYLRIGKELQKDRYIDMFLFKACKEIRIKLKSGQYRVSLRHTRISIIN